MIDFECGCLFKNRNKKRKSEFLVDYAFPTKYTTANQSIQFLKDLRSNTCFMQRNKIIRFAHGTPVTTVFLVSVLWLFSSSTRAQHTM